MIHDTQRRPRSEPVSALYSHGALLRSSNNLPIYDLTVEN